MIRQRMKDLMNQGGELLLLFVSSILLVQQRWPRCALPFTIHQGLLMPAIKPVSAALCKATLALKQRNLGQSVRL